MTIPHEDRPLIYTSCAPAFLNQRSHLSNTAIPNIIPIFLYFWMSFVLLSFLESIKKVFSQPDLFATSTSLRELDEFLLPITNRISHKGAIFFTANCLLVVA